MDASAVGEVRQRLARWVEEAENVLGVVPALFDEHERLRIMAEAAERECARLRQELSTLRAENEFLIGERGEIAEMIADELNRVMNDALQRLRAPATVSRDLQPAPTYS